MRLNPVATLRPICPIEHFPQQQGHETTAVGGRILPFVGHRVQTSDEVRISVLFLWVLFKIVLIQFMNALTWAGVALLLHHFFLSLLVASLLVGTEFNQIAGWESILSKGHVKDMDRKDSAIASV